MMRENSDLPKEAEKQDAKYVSCFIKIILLYWLKIKREQKKIENSSVLFFGKTTNLKVIKIAFIVIHAVRVISNC